MKLSLTLQRFISLVFLVALSCPTLSIAEFRPKDRTSAIQSIYRVFINMVSRMFPAPDEELRTNRAAFMQTTRRKLMTSLIVLMLKYARWFYGGDAAIGRLLEKIHSHLTIKPMPDRYVILPKGTLKATFEAQYLPDGEAHMTKLAYRKPTARAELWRVAAVVIMLGSLSSLAAQVPPAASVSSLAAQPPPAASVGTCSIPDQPVRLDKGVEVAAPPGFDALAFYDKVTERPLKDLTSLLKNSKWTINYEDLSFPPTLYTHMEHIRLAWTKRAEGEKSPLCLQPFRVPAVSAVTNVFCGPGQSTCYKGLGDQISIQVEDLDPWIKDHGAAQGRPTPLTAGDLVPFFDGVPLRGIHPENPGASPDEVVENFHSYHTLRFTLERNTSNRDAWNRLLSGLKWDGRLVDVSIGFEGGDPMPSWVQKDGASSDSPDARNYKTFTLIVLPRISTIVAALLFLVALVAFFWLVKATEILQDVSAPLRPDGHPPYSLARVQMAVWFFLVVGAWFLLFLVTKDIDTLTGSVLVLLGISAGTAVGSTILDAGTTIDAAARVRNVVADKDDLARRIKELRDRLNNARTGETDLNVDPETLQAEVRRLSAELTLAESQQKFFSLRPWQRLIYDVLGDDGHISFHRFQVAVWTLVLGFVFVIRVLSELSMPEFSATILGLMGISSGTYLGFKLPAASGGGTQAKN
jgi:hypothetical protein